MEENFENNNIDRENNLIYQQKVNNMLERLIKDGVIDVLQLQILREEITYTNEDITRALTRSNLISEAVINLYLGEEVVESINLDSADIDAEVVKKIPKKDAAERCVIAFQETANAVNIAMGNVSDIETIEYIKTYFNDKEIKAFLAKESDILGAIDKYYEYSFVIGRIIEELEAGSNVDYRVDTEHSYKSPVIRFVDGVLSDAVHKGASDIHIQPDEHFVRVRYRIDGVMQNQLTFDKKFYQSIVVRVKIISGMNIAESMRPQDGGIKASMMGRKIDFRVSLMPTIFGEGAVIRILDKKTSVSDLTKLGLSKDNLEKIHRIIDKPEGVLIVTGPTGSGKTTTLYAIISALASPGINIMTLEDPVEYHMPLARQMNVNHAAGIDFSSGLRAILRQDPDVILVGEMRDEETAITAMRAAMTGHKVFSTLHTNSAISAINRLLDLKVSGHIIASSVNGIIAQRLVRKICLQCGVKRVMADAEFEKYKIKKTKEVHVYDACGCKICNGTGYKGRIGVTEIIVFDKETRAMVEDEVKEHTLLNALRASKKFVPMYIDAIRKVMSGLTSFDEIQRCVDMSGD